MGISLSILLVAVGAVLTWAVSAEVSGIDINAVGVILMIVGAIGLLVSLVFWSSWGGFGARTRRRRPEHDRRRARSPLAALLAGSRLGGRRRREVDGSPARLRPRASRAAFSPVERASDHSRERRASRHASERRVSWTRSSCPDLPRSLRRARSDAGGGLRPLRGQFLDSTALGLVVRAVREIAERGGRLASSSRLVRPQDLRDHDPRPRAPRGGVCRRGASRARAAPDRRQLERALACVVQLEDPVERRDLEHAPDSGSVTTSGDAAAGALGGAGTRGEHADRGGVEERARAEVDDEARSSSPTCRERTLELGARRQVELALEPTPPRALGGRLDREREVPGPGPRRDLSGADAARQVLRARPGRVHPAVSRARSPRRAGRSTAAPRPRATSAWARMPTSRPSETTGSRRTRSAAISASASSSGSPARRRRAPRCTPPPPASCSGRGPSRGR